jgi:hypothetical protein
MLLSLPRKSTWTLHKVVPCVLQPSTSTIVQQSSLLRARARGSGATLTCCASIPAHLHGTAFRLLILAHICPDQGISA